MINQNSIYNASPYWLQELFLNIYACRIHFQRFGNKFLRLLDEWEKFAFASSQEINEFQNKQLQMIIKHAYSTVPYYRNTMERLKLTPSDFKGTEDLAKLPILTREHVKNNLNNLLSKNYKMKNLIPGHTSGTTGSPLEFFWDNHMCLINNVADWRQKKWAGLNYGEKHAVLLGRTIVPANAMSPPFWRMNHLHNQLWMSSFHMTEINLPLYLEKLKTFKPKIIEGYPSTVYILAKYLESKNEIFPVSAILTSSETLYPIQRETIEKVFSCRIFDFYGLAERTVFATECNHHQGHHLNMDYGITEILDGKSEPVPHGKRGWIVGTSLHNMGMPFLRYKTSDISSIKNESCSCGCNYPLMEAVTTKAEDIIVTKDGRFISPSVLTHPFKPMHHIKESQIVQEDEENITIKIVKHEGYSEKDTEQLLASFSSRVGEGMKINLEFVEEIKREANGKFRWVISKVPVNFQ